MMLADMQFVFPELRIAFAEIFVLAMACLILGVDVFRKSKSNLNITFGLTLFTLVGAAVITSWVGSSDISYTFSNMFVSDTISYTLKVCIYLCVLVVLCYSRAYVHLHLQMACREFYVLSLFSTLGMMVMVSANHFATVFIGIELLSLSLYSMVAIYRDSAVATEAAIKYFVLGALASGLLLYGISMIYGATGVLDISSVAALLFGGQGNGIILSFGVVFLVAGIAFKLGVVPFHMWIPDVYQGAPTPVGLFIASAPKFAAFAVAMRILVNGLIVAFGDWQPMLLILAVLSMALGNFAALVQTNIKRMLAYSAISHMGFMLLGLATGVIGNDARFMVNAYSSAMFYLVTYVLSTLGAFGIILLFSNSQFDAENINDFSGLNKRNSWYASMMMIMMFSMAGIPFFVGFFAKFAVLQAVIAAGYLWVAVAAIVFSLVGAYYYLRVVKVMYFDSPKNDTVAVVGSADVKVLISANGLALALIGIFPNALMMLCTMSVAGAIAF